MLKHSSKNGKPIPGKTGIGLRSPHYREILASLPAVPWMEVHSENFFSFGGAPIHYLDQIRSHYPVSLHGVGLSLGSADSLSRKHLSRLKTLVDRIEPCLVSEHLSWSSIEGCFLNDLLPMPYTQKSLEFMCRRVTQFQDFLGRRILIENVSSYLEYKVSSIPEWEFVAEVSSRTGCGILLDINNIYVSSLNHGFDPYRYLQSIPEKGVLEIHLAGFERHGDFWVDTHSRPVCEAVWDLYEFALRRFGEIPTLIEWDADIPELPVLIDEARKADLIAQNIHATTS